MKKIERLKLSQLGKADLERRAMGALMGGECMCSCACAGSSSTTDNANANFGYGIDGDKSYGSGSGYCWTESGGWGAYSS